MKIKELLNKGMTFSFEVFPPKDGESLAELETTLDKLSIFNPDFVSVTYGAGGTNVGQSEEICKYIIDQKTNLVSHFTCIGNTEEDVKENLQRYKDIGVENFLCLRGDYPEGWETTRGKYSHGDRLIKAVKEDSPELCVGGGCYPEMHIEAKCFSADIAHLRSKQDNGAEFLMSQLCYDIEAFQRFLRMKEKAGIDIPVIAGIMPVLYKNSLLKMTLLNGCSIPSSLAKIVGKYGENKEDFKKAGKEYVVDLIHKYMAIGVDGIHLYSLNKYSDLADIISAAGIRGNFTREEIEDWRNHV